MDITFRDRGLYLEVVCAAGEWDPVDVTATADGIRAHAWNAGRDRILIDWRAVSPPARDWEYKALAGEDVGRVLNPPLRVAVMNHRNRVTGISEAVARERGAALFVHWDRETLLTWLLR